MAAIRTRKIDVTPGMAKQWLATNHDNRNTSQGWVSKMARDMASGDFPFTGESIKFDENGDLIDGQHRLQALIQSGVRKVEMLIVEGIPRQHQRFMDKNRTRKVADSLSMELKVPSAPMAVATARIVLMWEIEEIKSGTLKPSDAEIYDWVGDNQELLNPSVRYGMKLRNDIGALPSPTAAVYFLTMRLDSDDANQFWSGVEQGVGLHEGDPELTLRNAIIRLAARGGEKQFKPFLAMLAQAWNAKREGRKIKRLHPKPNNELTDAHYRLH